MSTIPKPPLYKITLLQLVIMSVLCTVLALWDGNAALSVMTGSLIQLVPQAWFNYQAYRYTGARQARQLVQAMYRGEAGKIVLTATLFVTVFVLAVELNELLVMVSFIAMIPVHCWLAVKILQR